MTQQQRPELPPAPKLTARQQIGIDCAWCGAYLGPRWRPLGIVHHRGHFLYLYGCAPHCPPPQRTPGAAWPPGGPPVGAVPP